MCVGIPMQVMESFDGYALCDDQGVRQRIDTLLVGEQPVGTWLLTFLGTAREVLSNERAEHIQSALAALRLATAGDEFDPSQIDALFPDLAGREPELPPHLRSQSVSSNRK